MPNISEYLTLNRLVEAKGLFWLQGPGGNTSFKNKDILSIKPSGYRIHQLQAASDLSQVSLKNFLVSFSEVFQSPAGLEREQKYKSAIENASLVSSLRPSMETGFHAVLDAPYVFHIHSLWAVLATDFFWTRQEEFFSWYKKVWQKKLGSLVFIPATMPGADLALTLQKNKDAKIHFLKNHGSVIQFQNSEDLKNYELFEDDLAQTFFPNQKSKFENENFFSLPELRQGPLKFYFPDMAIIFPRLQKFLLPLKDGTFHLDSKIDQQDADALENWLASQILFRLHPSLSELPLEIISAVPYLPTEIVRKKIMESK